MKRFVPLAVMVVGILCSLAADACSDVVLDAVRCWRERQKFISAAEIGEPLCAECRETAAGYPFYVVPFSSRGYAVVACVGAKASVIAFSVSAEPLPNALGVSSLGRILSRDLAGRLGVSVAGHTGDADLVASYKLPKAAGSLQAISDVRVAPLLKSSWGQQFDTGYRNVGAVCFNYYTPGNMLCGCTATAMAQIMRYWEFPSRAPTGSYVCAVDEVATSLSIVDGVYDWENMPYVTSGGISEAQRREIGKLTYDCAVAMHSHFSTDVTYAYSDFAFSQLVDVFGFSSAVGCCSTTSQGLSMNSIRRTLYSNLDYGCPVMLCLLTPEGGGHQVVADGYGVVDGVEYVHLNMGWNGLHDESDVWYNLPEVSAGNSAFTIIDSMIYNIFPRETGDILSGRIVDEGGSPVSNVMVTATRDGVFGSSVSRLTNEKGIYAFLLDGGCTYTVRCGNSSKSVTLDPSVSAVCDWRNPLLPTFNPSRAGTCGNSWGNDFVLASSDPEPTDPEPTEPEPQDVLGPFMPTKAINGAAPYCGAVYDETGVVCGTMSLKIGKPSKKGVSKVSGTITLLDGKKYSVKSTDFPTNEDSPVSVSAIDVKKLRELYLTVGGNGFSAKLMKTSGGTLTAATIDLSEGLSAGVATFSVEGLPDVFDGYPVLQSCSANGQAIAVSTKGKWDCGKAATIKYVKVSEKDKETGEKISHYELQGLDDPKKPNLAALRLTYTAKTAMFKGSFSVYVDCGTLEKPKLKKVTASVVGFVVGGRGYGLATIKGAGGFPVSIQ